MAREADAALQAKVLRIGFVCAFLLGTMFAIRLLAHGSRLPFVGFVCLLLGALVVFLLDERFWMILPATALMTIRLTRLHGSVAFFCAVACFAVFLVRIPFRRDALGKLPRIVLFSLPLLCWVLSICVMNPPGFLIAGNSRIGARFYIIFAVGICLLFSFSRLRSSEDDCKLLYYLIFAGAIASFFHASWMHFFPSLEEQLDPESDAARYYLGGTLPILVLLLSRYRVHEFFLNSFRLFSALVVFCCILFSGKRADFGRMLLLPFVSSFLKKKDRFVMVWLAVVVGLVIGFLCSGQGVLFDLPKPVQRVLSVFPGKWDYRYERYGLNDDFRHELRLIGFDIIGRSPWFGRKGYAIDAETMGWVIGKKTMFEGHIYSGNWHNAWLSFAVDFGIPGFLFACLFIIAMLKEISVRLSRVEFGTWKHVCAIYYSVSIILQLAVSHVSGTSCTLFYYCALHFTMFLLVTNQDDGGVGKFAPVASGVRSHFEGSSGE